MPLAQPERRATGEQDPGWGGMSAKPPARVSQGRKKEGSCLWLALGPSPLVTVSGPPGYLLEGGGEGGGLAVLKLS